jgi:hypothetical protein
VALDKLANVKEFGTPQGVRAAARCYVCLVVPLFMGPYWAWVGTETDFAFAFFHSTLMELALVVRLEGVVLWLCVCALDLHVYMSRGYMSRGLHSLQICTRLINTPPSPPSAQGVLAAAMALEDPFDNAGLGGVFVDEALWEVEAAAGAAGGGAGGGGEPSPRRVVRVETETV